MPASRDERPATICSASLIPAFCLVNGDPAAVSGDGIMAVRVTLGYIVSRLSDRSVGCPPICGL
jgi:hypothetical protein